jgi:hypothetical protein
MLRACPDVTIEDTPDIGSADRPHITQSTVRQRILAEPWRELERILEAAHTGQEVDLRDSEEAFGAIRSISADSASAPWLSTAFKTQSEFAQGQVVIAAQGHLAHY